MAGETSKTYSVYYTKCVDATVEIFQVEGADAAAALRRFWYQTPRRESASVRAIFDSSGSYAIDPSEIRKIIRGY